MVKPDSYQHYLDNYLADVAAAAVQFEDVLKEQTKACLLYTSPSPRDKRQSRMPSSA